MNTGNLTDWRVSSDAESVAAAAAEYIAQCIRQRLEANGICHVALPGGTTPAHCLELLAQKALPWDNIHWYPGDERCLPVGHDERNDSMMIDRFLSRHPSVIENFHPIPAEKGARTGAREYATLIDSIGQLDIAVLGMGEDGHTASLFPGNPAVDDPASVVPVFDAPKAPAERVSLGLRLLAGSQQRMVIATGAGKAEAIHRIKKGAALPVALINAQTWFIDDSANSG